MSTPDDDAGVKNEQADLGEELAEQLLLGTVRSADSDQLVPALDALRSLRTAEAPAMPDVVAAAFLSHREQHEGGMTTVAARGVRGVGVASRLRLMGVAAAAVVILALSLSALGSFTGLKSDDVDVPSATTFAAPKIEAPAPEPVAPPAAPPVAEAPVVTAPTTTTTVATRAPRSTTPRTTTTTTTTTAVAPPTTATSAPPAPPAPPATPPTTTTSNPNLLTGVTTAVGGLLGGTLDVLL